MGSSGKGPKLLVWGCGPPVEGVYKKWQKKKQSIKDSGQGERVFCGQRPPNQKVVNPKKINQRSPTRSETFG